MLIKENIRMAITSLRANLSRTLLTMLGIIIGIASVIAIMTVGNSLTLSISSELQSAGANNITVYLNYKDDVDEDTEDENENGIVFGKIASKRGVTDSDLINDEMISALVAKYPDEVAAISMNESIGSTTYEKGRRSIGIELYDASMGYFMANEIEILAGMNFNQDAITNGTNVCLIEAPYADQFYDGDYRRAIGEELTLDVNGRTIILTIIGVYKPKQSQMMMIANGSSSTANCLIPVKTKENLFQSSGHYYFDIITTVGTNPDDFANKAADFFNAYYRSSDTFVVETFSMASMVSMMETSMSAITTAITIIAGIALLVGGIGVMNIMLVSITERTREIGTRKALGATNGSIRLQFITESMIMCLIGGAIGVVLGLGMGSAGAKAMGYPAAPSITSIIGSLLFSLAIGVFFGYYPANKAAKMNPIDALRYE